MCTITTCFKEHITADRRRSSSLYKGRRQVELITQYIRDWHINNRSQESIDMLTMKERYIHSIHHVSKGLQVVRTIRWLPIQQAKIKHMLHNSVCRIKTL